MRALLAKKQSCPGLTQSLRYAYTPMSCYKIENKINPILSVTFGDNTKELIELHIRLFENVVPKTTENFKRLLLGTATYKGRSLSLLNNRVHQFVPRSYIELGHLPEGNCSIFGPKFRDQSFELLHDRPGLLSSMSQENTNNSRFAITVAPCPFFDYKNIVFAEVTAETFGNLKRLQRLVAKERPMKIFATKEMNIVEASGHHEKH